MTKGTAHGGESLPHLVEGPLLMSVLGELVNEGVELLGDYHTIGDSKVKSADIGARPSFPSHLPHPYILQSLSLT